MGKVVKRLYTELVDEKPDRHANKVDIVFCKDNLYHVNFRNIQFRLTEEEFLDWKKGFKIAKEKLKDKMQEDI